MQLGGLWRPHQGFLLEFWHVDDSTTCFAQAIFPLRLLQGLWRSVPYAISVCVTLGIKGNL